MTPAEQAVIDAAVELVEAWNPPSADEATWPAWRARVSRASEGLTAAVERYKAANPPRPDPDERCPVHGVLLDCVGVCGRCGG